MDDDDDYSKTCGPVMDRRTAVDLNELFVPLAAKSKECDDLLAVAEEGDGDAATADDGGVEQTAAAAKTCASTALVNDINTRFSNDHTQTVGPYLDTADPSRKVSVRDLFKPLDSKSKEMHNLAEESEDDGDGDKPDSERMFHRNPGDREQEVYDPYSDNTYIQIYCRHIRTAYDETVFYTRARKLRRQLVGTLE